VKNKNSVTIIIAAVLVVIAAAGGYFVGRNSGDGYATRQVPVSSTEAGPARGGASLVADLEAKLRKNPDDVQSLYAIADTYFSMKRFDEAARYYNRLLKLKPDDADLYNDLGLSLHYLGKSAEGLASLEKGIKKNPYNQRIWLTKGFILAYGIGDLEKAGEAWKKARALDPKSSVGKAADNYLAQIKKTAKNGALKEKK